MASIIGIISDTHDNIPAIIEAVNIFKERDVLFVIHLGDIIAPATIKFFSGIHVKFIPGNCDGDIETIDKKISEIGGIFMLDMADMLIEDKRVMLFHGKPKEKIDEFIKSQTYDYILHGHDHKKRDEKIGKTRIINPGAFYLDPKQRDNTIALLDLERDKLEFIKI